ncbi:hypothetical protein L9F63_026792, partial [Diploptera punctata]
VERLHHSLLVFSISPQLTAAMLPIVICCCRFNVILTNDILQIPLLIKNVLLQYVVHSTVHVSISEVSPCGLY